MSILNYAYDAVHWYTNELASRVVAQSGVPNDRFHVGKILLQSLKDAPEFILQIDGATGEKETFESGLKRSVQCANALRDMGVKTHDTMVIMGPNHLHLAMPMYAGFYLGVAVAGVDMNLKNEELERAFNIVLPKVIFCQNTKATEVHQALTNINHNANIVTFDDSDTWLTFSKMLESGNYLSIDDFKASEFDSENTKAMLLATSGTTGLPKFVALSHKNWLSAIPFLLLPYTNFPTPFNMALLVSPVQWATATILFSLSPIYKFSRLQSSLTVTPEHFLDLVSKYRPSFTLGSPNIFLQVISGDECDLTCVGRIMIGGSAVPVTLLKYMKETNPNMVVHGVYGLSEIGGMALNNTNTVNGFAGIPMSSLQYRLVNDETQEDINEPFVRGELWLKGPAVFMGYYNDPEMTAQAKTTDGWLKTGDLFYRDENGNYFFVERLKMLMKYMNHQISPIEIEDVILKQPGVVNVAVTKLPDKERGDLPVACVVRREGSDITAQEIKDLVKNTLAETKQLRGGVIFLKELPMTSSMKVDRRKLASMVLDLKIEH